MIQKIISLLGILFFLIRPFDVLAESMVSLSAEDLISRNAITIEAKTGEILFEKNAHERIFPASTTKVMTGILLLELVEEDEIIVMTEESLHEIRSNSIVEFTAGEQLDRNTALDFIMLLSANDVAASIGTHIAGSREAFGELMTERAKKLGAMNTNFTNPTGLHQNSHFTTTYDMALIVREAMNHPALIESMSTRSKEVTTSKQTLTIPNRSNMFEIENFYAGRTGFTTPAQHTLAAITEKNGVHLINVVMRSSIPERYEDIEKLSNYAFSQIEHRVVVNEEHWSKRLALLGRNIFTHIKENVQIPTITNRNTEINKIFHPNEFTNEELYENWFYTGEELGQLDILVGENIVGTVQVVAGETTGIDKSFLAIPEEKTEGIFQSIASLNARYIALALLIIVMFIRTINIMRKKKKRKRKKRRKKRVRT